MALTVWLSQARVNDVVGQSFVKYPIIQSKYKEIHQKLSIMQEKQNCRRSLKMMWKNHLIKHKATDRLEPKLRVS